MRRTALGSISNKGRIPQKEKAVVRPRSSLGVGGRLSAGSKLATGSRPKTSFGSTSRRSSQYGRDNSYSVKDPRPLSDKSYQQTKIREIIQFLSENNFKYEISVKLLTSPSVKEFVRVFVFIYSWINSSETYKVMIQQRPEEEVPKILKSLWYPFTNIHKSSINNVGSPHTWAVVLGALHWMMELVQFSISVSDDIDQYLFQIDDGDDGESEMHRTYFEFLEKSYEAFMQGVELDNLGDYKDAFLDEIRSLNSPTISEVEQLAQENMKLEKELLQLNEPSKLEALVEKRDTLQADKTKFEAYIAELRRHRIKLDERLIRSEEALNTTELEQEAIASEKAKLQKILDNQELSAADVQRMKKESLERKKTLTKVEEQRDSLDQEFWETEMAYAKKHEQTLALLQEYNERARQLKLIPTTAENAAGADYELKCHLGRMTLDFNNVLKPNLLRFKQQLSECSRQCQSELFNLNEKHDQVQEQVTDKQEEVSTLEVKIIGTEKECQWRKEMYDDQHNQLIKTEEEILEKIDKLRERTREAKERAKKERKERTQYEVFLHGQCDLIIEHKTKIQARVLEVRKQAEEYLNFVENLPVIEQPTTESEELPAK